MDKPVSLSMKDYLIRKMAVKMMISEKVIEAVVSHQFNSANEAMLTNNSVEISGFCKFLFNHKKAVKRLATMELQKTHLENSLQRDITEHKRKIAETKIASLINSISILRSKITNDELETNSGGMEEQYSASLTSEKTDL
jgi:hypothetical protein